MSPGPSDPERGPDGTETRASQWDARYEAGTTGWDLGEPTPPLARWLAEHGVKPGARVLVPGCGRGHDARGWARHGGRVTGVDFAPRALEAARKLAESEALDIEWVQADVTALPSSWTDRFDVVWEHTCLCAIPPSLREPYLDEVRRVLAPGGTFLALLWAHDREGGPPFAMDDVTVRPLLAERFDGVEVGPAQDSVPDRDNEFVWVARGR